MTALENSEVLLLESMAVAAIVWPTGTAADGVNAIGARPSAPIVTVVSPRKTWPSP